MTEGSFREGVRKLMPRYVRRLFYKLGSFLIKGNEKDREYFPDTLATFKYLREWGFCPVTIVDVGAYHGDWTKVVKKVFPSAKVFMIEAQQSKEEILLNVSKAYGKEVDFEIALLGSENDRTVEFIDMESGSSVFEENSPFPRKRIKKETKTLDQLISKRCRWKKIDLLKLDVQGYELEVLKGALKYLPKCEFVFLEASLIPINKNAPLIDEVINYMKDKGFILLDICSQIRRKDRALWQIDVIFVNNKSHYRPKPELKSLPTVI